jgi:hypothetical protein
MIPRHATTMAVVADEMIRAVTVAMALLLGLLVGRLTEAREASIEGPRWVIILTLTDRTTGAQFEQRELDPNLQFDDRAQCQSMVAKVGAIPATDHFAAVLTCRKVTAQRDDS